MTIITINLDYEFNDTSLVDKQITLTSIGIPTAGWGHMPTRAISYDDFLKLNDHHAENIDVGRR